MAVVTWSALATAVSYITTGLNALANGSNAVGGAIDNSAGHIWAVVELNLGTQAARTAGARVDIYSLKSIDGGTTYEAGDASTTPMASALVGSIPLDAVVTARRVSLIIQMPPGFSKLLIQNQSTQAFAATGNTFSYAFFDESVA